LHKDPHHKSWGSARDTKPPLKGDEGRKSEEKKKKKRQNWGRGHLGKRSSRVLRHYRAKRRRLEKATK